MKRQSLGEWLTILGLLLMVLCLGTACRGTLEVAVETTPAAEATITALEREKSQLATKVAHHESRLGRLAYVQGGDIWVKELPDGEPQRLTTDGHNSEPRWSPSGQWLAFRRGDHNRVWIMRADGVAARQANQGRPVDAFAWSPAEDRLAYVDASNGKVHVQAADAEQSEALVREVGEDSPTPPERERGVAEIAWSPDGTRIAYTLVEHPQQAGETAGPPSYQALWVVPVGGGEPEEIYDSGVPERGMVHLCGWTVDGGQVLFWQGEMLSASMLADGVPLYALPMDGGEPIQLVDAVLLHSDFVAAAPSGPRVAVVAGGGRTTWTNKRLAIVQPEGEEVTCLTSEDVAALSPAWSPDGTRLAYSAMPDEEGLQGGEAAREAMRGRRLWMIDADGEGPEQLTDDSDYRDERPLWSTDGSHLLFARFDARDRASLWLVPLEAGEPQQVVEELTPAPEWFGNYGHIAWHQCFDWWRGDIGSATASSTPSTPAMTPTATSTAVGGQDAFSASRTALANYEPVQDATSVVSTLSQECALWLSRGGDPAALADTLRSLPKVVCAEVEERLWDHVPEERPGALLRFPVTVEGVLCCEPGTMVEPVPDADESPWPQVGVFEAGPYHSKSY